VIIRTKPEEEFLLQSTFENGRHQHLGYRRRGLLSLKGVIVAAMQKKEAGIKKAKRTGGSPSAYLTCLIT